MEHSLYGIAFVYLKNSQIAHPLSPVVKATSSADQRFVFAVTAVTKVKVRFYDFHVLQVSFVASLECRIAHVIEHDLQSCDSCWVVDVVVVVLVFTPLIPGKSASASTMYT